MGEGHVQVAPDSTGKDIDADALTSTETGNPTVYRQDIVVADPSVYGNKAHVTRNNALKVAMSDELGASLFQSQTELLVQVLDELIQIKEFMASIAGFTGKHDLNKFKR